MCSTWLQSAGKRFHACVSSPPDLPAEAEPGDAAVPVAVVAAAAAAPVQSGEGAPEDAAGRAAEGAPEAPAAPAGGPLLLHAGHGARQAARPEGRSPSAHTRSQRKLLYGHLLCVVSSSFHQREQAMHPGTQGPPSKFSSLLEAALLTAYLLRRI